MKKVLLLPALSALLSVSLHAGDDDVNVLGYYAVSNSLDGQPMIDMVNVLRFYPVFAMRDSVAQVSVTVYYGGNIFERDAQRMDDGRYWQVLLPIFRLGEAIQRIEVDVHFALDARFRSRYDDAKDYADLGKSQYRSEQDLKKERMKKATEEAAKIGIEYLSFRDLRKAMQKDENLYRQKRDSVLTIKKRPSSDTSKVDRYVKDYLSAGESYISSYKDINAEIERGYARLDSIRDGIADDIEAGLSDTLYSGPSVRRSDLIIDSDFRSARILYRNYKKGLRHLVALDPAERLGIFRVRYVPFPITALPKKSKTSLRGPFGSDFTVFEVGLTFGDAIVTGDDFVTPQFAWNRLGVAFAITEKLFSDSAQVIALALTYDFNSYGSVGLGGNFAQGEANPYFSFGINKKAFEAVLSALAGIFK